MKRRKIMIIGIAGFILLILVGIGGVGYLGWNIFADQAKAAIQNNSVIQQHIGEVEKIKVDLMATGRSDGDNVFVFNIEGSGGAGVITAEFVTVDADTEEIRSGTLRLSTGETYDLLE